MFIPYILARDSIWFEVIAVFEVFPAAGAGLSILGISSDLILVLASGGTLAWMVWRNRVQTKDVPKLFDLNAPSISADAFMSPLQRPQQPKSTPVNIVGDLPPEHPPLEPAALVDAAFSTLLDEVFVIAPDHFEVLFMNARARSRAEAEGHKDPMQLWELIDGLGQNRLADALVQMERDGRETARVNVYLESRPMMLELRPIYQEGLHVCYVALLRAVPENLVTSSVNHMMTAVSQDIETPLASAKGAIDILTSGSLGTLSTQAQETLAQAQLQLAKIEGLSVALDDLKRLTDNEFQLNRQKVDLRLLVQEAVTSNTAMAETWQVGLASHVMVSGPAQVNADPDRLRQVLDALIANAVKFSPARNDVLLSLQNLGPRFRVTVLDHGPGLSKSVQSALFERASPTENALSKPGSITELLLAQALIKAQGGVLGFDTVMGEGTAFYFELPRHFDKST